LLAAKDSHFPLKSCSNCGEKRYNLIMLATLETHVLIEKKKKRTDVITVW
jgi:hypothetical protein